MMWCLSRKVRYISHIGSVKEIYTIRLHARIRDMNRLIDIVLDDACCTWFIFIVIARIESVYVFCCTCAVTNAFVYSQPRYCDTLSGCVIIIVWTDSNFLALSFLKHYLVRSDFNLPGKPVIEFFLLLRTSNNQSIVYPLLPSL